MKKIKTYGHHIKIKPEQSGGMLTDGSLIDIGIIIDIGHLVKAPIKKGNKVYFKTWLCDKAGLPGEESYYITEPAILEIL